MKNLLITIVLVLTAYVRAQETTSDIQFSLLFTNNYFNTNLINVKITVQNGSPSFMAASIDNTNLDSIIWQPFNSNFKVNLGSNAGWHEVWIWLKGPAPDAQPTWQWEHLYLASPPLLVVTNPVANVVSQPIIQIYGYCQEPLASISYDMLPAGPFLS